MPRRPRLLPACLALLLAASPASAAEGPDGGWRLALADDAHAPRRFLAIDKASQTFYVLERHSPIKAVRQLPCTTGQQGGDKLTEGDLRTPEGVYFLQRKLTGGLDQALYGGLAYTLNFPNPVDRIKGKTGHGIWLHGRGAATDVRGTKGCVALAPDELRELDPVLVRGTPVLIAGQLTLPAGTADTAVSRELAGLVSQWAQAMQNRSLGFFDYYDARSFDAADTEGFGRFRAATERMFRASPWMQVLVGDVTVLPGPDYWVTSFPRLVWSQAGVQQSGLRLYWQRQEAGWRIVGREEDAAPAADLLAAFLERIRPGVDEALERWLAAWRAADLDTYARSYAADARQQDRHGLEAILRHKRELWKADRPLRIDIRNTEVAVDDAGLRVSFDQDYQGAASYADRGRKTLTLVPQGQGWRIAQEDWRAR